MLLVGIHQKTQRCLPLCRHGDSGVLHKEGAMTLSGLTAPGRPALTSEWGWAQRGL